MAHFEPLDPLSTIFIDDPDYNQSDEDGEIQRLFQRQEAISSMLDGKISVDDALDLLQSQGINPDDYAAAAIDNMDWVMKNGLILPGSLCDGTH